MQEVLPRTLPIARSNAFETEVNDPLPLVMGDMVAHGEGALAW